jgi:tetratricopeptide (TPR) repeat protein
MSKRFANLEFNDENRRDQSRETPPARKLDEQYYMAQAVEENHWAQYDKALRLYTRCLEHSRAMIPAWVGQVQMLVQMGEYQEARVWSDKALELFRENGELMAAKAQACARLRDNRAAMACSDASLQAPGTSPWRWIARGETILTVGQDYYEHCFRKAVNEPGNDWFDRVIIARIYLFYRRAGNAIGYLKQAQELDPARGCIWFEMGNCQVAMGLTAAARASYQRCLELRPKFPEARKAMDSLGEMSFMDWLKAKLGVRK